MLGRVWRANTSLAKLALALTKPVNGKRLRGRPRLRWEDEVWRDVRALKQEATVQQAYDLPFWNALTESAMALMGPKN